MSSLQKEPKIYGAVESQSFVTFTGFCKKIYDNTQQSVEVFIDGNKVDTLLANQKIRDIENKYEVFDTNGFCFTYELPKEYIGQKHKLEFKTQEGEQLLHSPTHTLDRFSPLYNQAMFIESLTQETTYNTLSDGYTKNALSFIAIEENLSDEGFIEFVLEMCKKHKELTLSIFYFNEHQKNEANKVFGQIKNKELFNPSNIEGILQKSEIYLHNVVEEFRFTINEEYYNKVKSVKAIKNNLFVLELTRKAKKKKDLAEMIVHHIVPISFKISIMAEIFKDHERCNEFMFENSLNQPIDEEKIKDVYCPNSVGFLATKENLEDEVFVEYIKELIVRFPTVNIKGLYFKKADKLLLEETLKEIQGIEMKNIYDIASNIEIFLWNMKDSLDLNIAQSLISVATNIFGIYNFRNTYFLNLDGYTLADLDQYFEQHKDKILQNPKNVGFTDEEILLSGDSYHKLVYGSLISRELKSKFEIDLQSNALEFLLFTQIELALTYKNFKKDFIKMHKLRNMLK